MHRVFIVVFLSENQGGDVKLLLNAKEKLHRGKFRILNGAILLLNSRGKPDASCN